MTTALNESANVLREAVRDASSGLIERESLVELIVLAAVASEHVLVIGPPGTAKSEAVRRVARAMNGRYFEYLLGRFTEPSELFGPIDLRKLREGVVETETAGMLPEAEIAFLDEVFLGSTAILNTLLGVLNERTFRRGHTHVRCPLRVCVGASNALPEEPALAAFADRFLVRAFLDALPDPYLEALLEGGWSVSKSASPTRVLEGMRALEVVSSHAARVNLEPVRSAMAHAIRKLRANEVSLSDRRVVRTQRLIAAAAALAGRDTASEADLWPLVAVVPTREEQTRARDALRDLLERTNNPVLTAAAAETSLGPLARAQRIADHGASLMKNPPNEPVARDAWLLQLEGVAREIDSSFARDALPALIAPLRGEIAELLKTATRVP